MKNNPFVENELNALELRLLEMAARDLGLDTALAFIRDHESMGIYSPSEICQIAGALAASCSYGNHRYEFSIRVDGMFMGYAMKFYPDSDRADDSKTA